MIDPRPHPAPWMHRHYLDDGAVLFCASDRSLYALNPTSAVIWTLLEEGYDEASAGPELARLAGIDLPRATRFVAEALAQWTERGFLAGCTPPPPPVAPAPRAESLPSHRPEFAPVAVRTYRLLGTSFTIRYERSADATRVDPVLAHLAAAPAETSSTIDVATSGSGLAVYQDGVARDQCRGPDELAPVIKSLVWLTAVNSADHLLNIHAGVVGDDRGCILLPAASGSGKSTLCAFMMARGYRLLSDEAALLQRGTLDVVPVPLALAIKDTGIAAVAEVLPEVCGLPIHERHDGKRVAYLPPRGGSTNTSLTAHSIVFPRYVCGGGTRLEPIPRADALARLLDDCVAIPSPLTPDDIGALVEWMAGRTCYQMQFGEADEAVKQLVAVLARAPIRATL
jgi:hypothetical protein